MHLVNGVYLEIDGEVFEIRDSSLKPIENRHYHNKDLESSENNGKSDKKEGNKEAIDPRMD